MPADEPDPVPNPNPTPNPDPKPSLNPQQAAGAKRKRNLPGTPDPEAEVVALSPGTLLMASTFVCEVCGREFRRDQNLQIHRRGHNLPSIFRPKPPDAAAPPRKRVYVCPEESCVYHDPSRALGDLTGIKKHYSRKHGEKKWECDKCSKKYAVRTDWKAHTRICGSREYECDCGTLFSRKDSYILHKASCVVSTEEGEDDLSASVATVDFSFRTTTVSTELLFPSLWGQSSSQPEPKDDRRTNTEES